MHDLISTAISAATKEADTIEEGYVERSQFVKECANQLNQSEAVVSSFLNKQIAKGTIEQKTFKQAGIEGFQTKKAYVRKIKSKKEEVKK